MKPADAIVKGRLRMWMSRTASRIGSSFRADGLFPEVFFKDEATSGGEHSAGLGGQ